MVTAPTPIPWLMPTIVILTFASVLRVRTSIWRLLRSTAFPVFLSFIQRIWWTGRLWTMPWKPFLRWSAIINRSMVMACGLRASVIISLIVPIIYIGETLTLAFSWLRQKILRVNGPRPNASSQAREWLIQRRFGMRTGNATWWMDGQIPAVSLIPFWRFGKCRQTAWNR